MTIGPQSPTAPELSKLPVYGPQQCDSELTQQETQNLLPEEHSLTSPKAQQPSVRPDWGERFHLGLEQAGLTLGCVACGVLSLGLFPFSLLDLLLYATGNEGLQQAGMIIAAPGVGLVYCVQKLRDLSGRLDWAKAMARSILIKYKKDETDDTEGPRLAFKQVCEGIERKNDLITLRKYVKSFPVNKRVRDPARGAGTVTKARYDAAIEIVNDVLADWP